MTNFENKINGGQFAKNTICCMVNDLENNTTFEANINALNLREVDGKLPAGFEADHVGTLQNYFDHKVIREFELELLNDEYIYNTDFKHLVNHGFYTYVHDIKSNGMNFIKDLFKL